MKPKLTAEELAFKRARDQLNYISNRIKGAYSFGHIKTYGDLLSAYGMSEEDCRRANIYKSELERAIEYPDIKEFLSDKFIELSTAEWLRKNPPIIEEEESDGMFGPGSGAHYNLDQLALCKPHVDTEEEKAYKAQFKLPPSPKEKAKLFWFQKKAVIELLKSTTEYFESQAKS